MILDRLQISGFLSYTDPVVVDFSDFNLACISGANGAGKSSLLEAITWVLFGEARRRDDAVINTHSKAAEVTLDFGYEGAFYQVYRNKARDKSTLLEFRLQNPEGGWMILTEPTLRATEDLIRRTLHLDYETFTNASFFLQGKADQFAQQRPGDRKRILSAILGLDIWESYREEAARRRKIHETDLKVVENLLIEIEQELQQEGERKDRLRQCEREVEQKKNLFEARKTLLDQQRLIFERVESDRQQLEKQRAELRRVEEEHTQIQENLYQRLEEVANYRQILAAEEEVNREVAAWENARQALSEWERIAANFHQFESQRQAPALIIEGERARLQTELNTLQQQDNEIHALMESLPALLQQVEEYQTAVTADSEKLATRPQLEAELRRLVEEKGRLQAENLQLKSEMEEIKTRMSNLEVITGATCPTCEKPLSTEERQRLLAELQKRGTEKGNAYRQNQKMMTECETRYRELETELLNLQRVEADLKLNQHLFDAKSEELRLIKINISDWQEKKAPRIEELQVILQSGYFALEARQKLAAIDEHLKELGYDAMAHEQARHAEQEGRESQEKLRQIDNARSALAPLEREIASLESSAARVASHLAKLSAELKEAEEKFQLETANLPQMDQLEADYYAAQEQWKQALNELGYARNQLEVLTHQRQQKALRMEEKESLNEKIADLKILERAFSKEGIPAQLIEQALPDIEAHANEILDRLSAGGMALSFETQRDFKDKKREGRRETLDILIRDASGERPYEMFSGGEAFRINFALRLALSRVLAHRAGARLQTLVIDEGFGSQDTDGRQRLVEAINLVSNEFEKILVITHLEELKDAFPARIEVTKTPAGSQVQVVVA